ncbi:MAG: DUF1638 domain-containing protein [Enterobacterales bacterium]|nr:DUF1638 domain-containing protein [Enterobacterales bacterium]
MNQPLPPINIIACGALAKELMALKSINHWQNLSISCLPAKYHNTPALIPAAVEKKILQIKANNDAQILVAYGDCGTAGVLDKVLQKYDIERLPGAHCYQFFVGQNAFDNLQEEEIGTFYLTDFLVKQFDSYVWKNLGLDRHPELLNLYFGNYKRLVYLAQTTNDSLTDLAKSCAARMGLKFERIFTGYGDMANSLERFKQNKIPFLSLAS